MTIADSATTGFIDQAEVERLLKKAHLYPVGIPVDSVNGKAIEKCLLANGFVKTAVCYKSAGGEVNVVITQRQPVMRVMAVNGDDYYIDETGNQMEPWGYHKNLVVATGHIDSAYAKNLLVNLGLYLQDHPFWDSQVVQVNVAEDKRVSMVMRVGTDVLVDFGELDSIDRKFRHLKVFYEKVMPEVGWDTYKSINLEYRNQIVCRK